jgi:hypothetical protein
MRLLIATALVLLSYSCASAQNIGDIIGRIIGAAIQQNQQRYNQQYQPPMSPQIPQNGYSSPRESPWAEDDPPPASPRESLWAKDDPPPRASTTHEVEAPNEIEAPHMPRQASNLPACDEGSALNALKYQVLGNPASNLGALSEFMIVDHVIAFGINNIDGSKMCKAALRCDMDAARAKEAHFYGPHRLSGLCYQLNQAANAGNAVGLRFSIRPNGEGGTIITSYGN